MRQRRGAAAASLLISIGSLAAPATARADSTSTFYVNGAGSGGNACSDSTADSSTTPYCTIQAAVNAATAPGDTVVVAPGTYSAFTVSSTGTAAAPITIESATKSYMTSSVSVSTTSATTPAIKFSGASYVDLVGMTVAQNGTANAVEVSDSADITVDSNVIHGLAAQTSAAAVAVDGDSSSVTVSRNQIGSESAVAAVALEGGSGDVVTTNAIQGGYLSPGILVNGSTGADIVSNTVSEGCGENLDVVDGSTGATIENNIIGYGSCTAGAGAVPAADLLVDSTSTQGTTEDYNIVTLTSQEASAGSVYYSWGGVTYASRTAFTTGTTQGAHDFALVGAQSSSDQVDSANSAAPGELSTDVYGNPRVDDPYIVNTGAGPYTYYDRGAVETQDPLTITSAANWPTMMPDDTGGTFTATVATGWTASSISNCTYDFGDATPAVTVSPADGQCTAPHTYSGIGTYSISLTVTADDGSAKTITRTVTTDAGGQLLPALEIERTDARDLWLANDGYNGWNIVECDLDFGDGTVITLTGGECGDAHHYAATGTFPVSITVTDSDGQVATSTGSFASVGSYYNPLPSSVRILDTRKAIGVPKVAQVPAGGTETLQITGSNGVPAGATAVALNVTATDVSAGGNITAYPAGTSAPTASNLNIGKGQTVANTVIVKLSPSGAVTLKNNATGPLDLIADLEGYYADGGSAYHSTGSFRLLDTRTAKTTLQKGATIRLSTGYDEAAVVLNVTATNPTAGGNITAYADGAKEPGTSNLNFGKGATVANEVIVPTANGGYVDFTNNSPGSVDLIVDITGYLGSYTNGLAFVPMAPTRELDTRTPYGQFTGELTPSGALSGHGAGTLQVPGFPVLQGSLWPQAFAANVTVTGATAGGFATAYETGTPGTPTTSTLNFGTGATVANAATIDLEPNSSSMQLYNGSPNPVQLIVDLEGYYA